MTNTDLTQNEKMIMASFLAYQDLMNHLLDKGLTAEQADAKVKSPQGMEKMKELSLKYYTSTNA